MMQGRTPVTFTENHAPLILRNAIEDEMEFVENRHVLALKHVRPQMTFINTPRQA
jgi:hypothetical protein